MCKKFVSFFVLSVLAVLVLSMGVFACDDYHECCNEGHHRVVSNHTYYFLCPDLSEEEIILEIERILSLSISTRMEENVASTFDGIEPFDMSLCWLGLHSWTTEYAWDRVCIILPSGHHRGCHWIQFRIHLCRRCRLSRPGHDAEVVDVIWSDCVISR